MATESVVQILLRARDEATSKIKGLSNELGGLGGTVSKLTAGLGDFGAMTTGITAVAGAAVALAKNFSDAVISLDRVSHGAGTTRAELQILRKDFEDAGLGADAADTAVQKMGIAIGNQDPLLKRLHITSRNAFQAILQLSDEFARSADQASKDAIAKQLLGRSAKDLVGIMDTLRFSTDDVGARMRAAGAIISDEVAAKARALHDSLDELGIKWAGLWLQMETAMLDPATTIVGKITGIMDAFDRATTAWEKFHNKMPNLGEVRGGFGGGGSWGPPATRAELFTGPPMPTAADRLESMLKGEAVTMQEWIRNALIVSDVKAKIVALQPRGIEPGSGDWSKFFKIDEKVPVPQLTRGVLADILAEFNRASQEALTFANVVSNGLNAVWSGLDAGFSQVFANIFDRTQTLGSAMKSIFRSVVQSIMSYLGQLVASSIFNLFLRLVGAALGIPTAVLPFVPGPFGGPAKHGLQPAGPATALSGGAAGGNTYIINAIDSRTALMDLTMPGGALRGAFDSLELRNAY